MSMSRIDPKNYGDDMPEISFCPCCGKRSVLLVDDKENGDTSLNYRIQCVDTFGCGLSMFTSISGYSPNFTDELQGFIDRWNRRATEPAMTDLDARNRLLQIRNRVDDPTEKCALDYAIDKLR